MKLEWDVQFSDSLNTMKKNELISAVTSDAPLLRFQVPTENQDLVQHGLQCLQRAETQV